MPGRLLELHVENFRSLRDVTVPLGPLTVLVGPNGAGKSNVLKVFHFLADIIRTDLQPALDSRRGFDEVAFWGGSKPPTSMRIQLKATWTSNASLNAPDEYNLVIRRRSLPSNRDRGTRYTLSREESFAFKRKQGRGRRITIAGEEARVVDERAGQTKDSGSFGIRRLSSGLSTLPRLGPADGGDEVTRVADRLSSFRVFDVDVEAARQPTRLRGADFAALSPHAENLAGFLIHLSGREEIWDDLVADARTVLPQLENIEFEEVGGSTDQLTVVLREHGLRRLTPLADASYGTVRLLGLLALLYDPNPPAFTCIEEIDHGLHPQALELVVQRLREAAERTQFIVATHSPALVNRLRPEEFVVCDRDDDGASIIPALTVDEVKAIVEESGEQPLGELWFSGVLGGDPVRLRRKTGADLAAAVKALAGKARARARQQRAELLGFVVHEDLDGYADAGYDRVRKALTDELTRQRPQFRTALALAAWESESWLLLFPDAFRHVRPRWKVPAKLLDKDTGRIRDAKEELKRGLGLPVFRESDGPAVAREALTRRLIPSPRGSNRSYDDFVGDLAGWT